MGRLETLCLPGVAFLAILLAAAVRLYSRRSRKRIPCQQELDDPEVAEAFSRVALMPQMGLMRRYVARRATEMTARGEAVDLGCGPGYLAVEMARRAPELHVTGIDLSDKMLTEAEDYAGRHDMAQAVSFRKGDVQQIPFADGSVDLVVSTLSLHHWSDPVAVLDEVDRVLRPGGSFLIFDLRRDLSAPAWLLLWMVTGFLVEPALRRANEPLASRNAAYTPLEARELAERSRLRGWRVTRGPVWLIIEGCKQDTA
ncbi:MAG: methyltransferase domain-containing protein [Anaerolineae bacterium]|nr:methyltransferase domain-containing protein [Anaerolineae bacterium]